MPAGAERIAAVHADAADHHGEGAVDPMYQPVENDMFSDNVGGYYIHPVWINNYLDYWKK